MILDPLKFQTKGVKLIRYGERVSQGGILSYGLPEVTNLKAHVQIISNLKNLREVFGSHITSAVLIISKTELRIKNRNHTNDIIHFKGEYWRVVTTIKDDLVMKKVESEAVYIDNVPKEILNLSLENE